MPAALSTCCPLNELDLGWLVNLKSRRVTEACGPRLSDCALTADAQHPHLPTPAPAAAAAVSMA